MDGESEPLCFERDGASSSERVEEFREGVREFCESFCESFGIDDVMPVPFDEGSEDVSEAFTFSVLRMFVREFFGML